MLKNMTTLSKEQFQDKEMNDHISKPETVLRESGEYCHHEYYLVESNTSDKMTHADQKYTETAADKDPWEGSHSQKLIGPTLFKKVKQKPMKFFKV